MPDCSDLLGDPDMEPAHEVLRALGSRGIKPKNRVPRISHQNVEDLTGLRRSELFEKYDELEIAGFIELVADGRKVTEAGDPTDKFVRMLVECSCDDVFSLGGEPLGSHPERRRTRPSGSAADGGRGSRSEGPGTEGASKNARGSRARRRRRETVAEKPPSRMSAHDLALVFARSLDDSPHRAQAVDPVNFAVLRKNLSRWRKEGLDSAVIYEMIHLFVKDPRRWTRAGAPPAWKCFLADRQDLLNKATNLAKSKSADNGGWEEVREKQRVKSSPEDESFEAVRERLRARRSRG